LGVGTYVIWRQLKWRLSGTRLLLGRLSLGLLILISLGLSWRKVAGYFNVNHWEYQRAGQAVAKLTPLNAKVIAPAFGDTQFLFQTERTGWPIGFEIEQKIAQGATHYVTTSFDDEAQQLAETYAIIEKNKEFLILDLTIKQP
jgi:hypothetical protein